MPPTHGRRVASLVFGLSLAAVSMKLAGCSGPLDPGPPNPHEQPDGDPPGDPPDAGDAGEDAP